MGSPTQIPGGDAVLNVWQDLAVALASGDTEQIQTAVHEASSLSPSDQQLIEDLIAMMPSPTLPPLLLTQIFSDPETAIGALSRLSGSEKDAALAYFGTVESAIVLASVVSFMQNQNANAQLATEEAIRAQEMQPTSSQQNPINTALQAYINNAGTGGAVDAITSAPSTESVQFLKDNPILLSGIQAADPQLLTQALQIAEGQAAVTMLNNIIAAQTLMQQVQAAANTNRAAAQPSPEQQMASSYLQDLKEGKLQPTQSVMMCLQVLLVNAAAMQAAGATAAAGQVASISPADVVASTTAIASTEAGLQLTATQNLTTSWQTAFPNIYPAGPTNQIASSPDLQAQLGLLASVYSQMAPYWAVPAAVSFATAQGGQNAKTATEASVRAYAVALGTLISSPDFTLMVQSLILRAVPDPESITTEQLNAYTSGLKITMLMNALVALKLVILRQTNGQFSAQELRDLIMGKVALPTSDDLETGLIRTIQEELKNIPVANQEAFITNLLNTYSGQSNIDALIDPSKQFLGLCDQSLFRNQTAAESA